MNSKEYFIFYLCEDISEKKVSIPESTPIDYVIIIAPQWSSIPDLSLEFANGLCEKEA